MARVVQMVVVMVSPETGKGLICRDLLQGVRVLGEARRLGAGLLGLRGRRHV